MKISFMRDENGVVREIGIGETLQSPLFLDVYSPSNGNFPVLHRVSTRPATSWGRSSAVPQGRRRFFIHLHDTSPSFVHWCRDREA
jgi:hypothetical protein